MGRQKENLVPLSNVQIPEHHGRRQAVRKSLLFTVSSHWTPVLKTLFHGDRVCASLCLLDMCA